MEIAPQRLRDIRLVQDETEKLLRELADLGFNSKAVVGYHHLDKDGDPFWVGLPGREDAGEITLCRNNHPGAVAHEMGHGFHERLRHDRKLDDKFGEDYAEAIRWFTEERLGWTDWQRDFRTRPKKDDRILVACGYRWESFVDMLQRGNYYPKS